MIALSSRASSNIAYKILDRSDDLIIATTSEFIVEVCNTVALHWLGLSEEQVVGCHIDQMFDWSACAVPFELAQLDLTKEHSVIKPMNDSEGASFLCQWYCLPLSEDQNDGYLIRGVISSDLASIARNSMQIINCVPGSLYWKDLQGNYLGCNNVMLQTAGLASYKDIVGKTDYDLWPENADRIRENDIVVLETGDTLATEEAIKLHDGELMYFTGVKMPLRDEYDNIIGIVGNSIDISELKKNEAELIAAKRLAEQSNLVKAEFINNMEHDIRTPFNGVWGFANILAEREVHPEKKEQLQAIANCAKELLNYCDGVLDFSRVEHGEVPIMDKCFSIRRLMKSVIDVDRIAAVQKGLSLQVELDDNLPETLMGDSYRLKRVLLNLLGNAIKFTNAGFVAIRIHLAVSELRSCVLKFIVEDTGIGIPEDKQGVVYERFSRGTASNRGLYKGHGLGLRIVKQFVSELDGQIHLKSEIDVGTKFIIYLPFALPLINEVLDDE